MHVFLCNSIILEYHHNTNDYSMPLWYKSFYSDDLCYKGDYRKSQSINVTRLYHYKFLNIIKQQLFDLADYTLCLIHYSSQALFYLPINIKRCRTNNMSYSIPTEVFSNRQLFLHGRSFIYDPRTYFKLLNLVISSMLRSWFKEAIFAHVNYRVRIEH